VHPCFLVSDKTQERFVLFAEVYMGGKARWSFLCWAVAVCLVLVVTEVERAEGDVWQLWSDRAYKMCMVLVKKAKQTEGKCDNIQEVVETALQGLAGSMARAMQKDHQEYREELVLNSLKMPYRSQGIPNLFNLF